MEWEKILWMILGKKTPSWEEKDPKFFKRNFSLCVTLCFFSILTLCSDFTPFPLNRSLRRNFFFFGGLENLSCRLFGIRGFTSKWAPKPIGCFPMVQISLKKQLILKGCKIWGHCFVQGIERFTFSKGERTGVDWKNKRCWVFLRKLNL